jgi:putative flavoprotein involved in K+ transport
VIEKGSEAGTFWRDSLWDGFRMVTPNWSIQMPGMEAVKAAKGLLDHEEGFLSKAEMLHLIEEYRVTHNLPLQCNEEVRDVRLVSQVHPSRGSGSTEGGPFVVETDQGVYEAADVVVCTGPYPTPYMPLMSTFLPERVKSIHSSQYVNPELVGDTVIVVGSGQSGCQISSELAKAGKKVYLSLSREPASIPRTYKGSDNMDWLSRMGFFSQTLEDPNEHMPTPDELRLQRSGSACIATGEFHLHNLAMEGVTLLGRLKESYFTPNGSLSSLQFNTNLDEVLVAYQGTAKDFKERVDGFIHRESIQGLGDPRKPPSETQVPEGWVMPEPVPRVRLAGVDTVIWATGYGGQLDYPMLKNLPKQRDLTGPGGYPEVSRGQSISCPGLYFLGLRWLHSAASGILFGAAHDAGMVARTIQDTRGFPEPLVELNTVIEHAFTYRIIA